MRIITFKLLLIKLTKYNLFNLIETLKSNIIK